MRFRLEGSKSHFLRPVIQKKKCRGRHSSKNHGPMTCMELCILKIIERFSLKKSCNMPTFHLKAGDRSCWVWKRRLNDFGSLVTEIENNRIILLKKVQQTYRFAKNVALWREGIAGGSKSLVCASINTHWNHCLISLQRKCKYKQFSLKAISNIYTTITWGQGQEGCWRVMNSLCAKNQTDWISLQVLT